jgi:BirA family biotin operon repressor/biotin-[acetyl-CoA-carboxylase] ligase
MTHVLSSTIFEVLNILNDCAVHTGSDIAACLGISRTAVWKIIQRLKKYDIEIQSQHQGYRLASPLFLFDKKQIERRLEAVKVNLEIFETIPSTSVYLKNKSPLKSKNICLAEYQTKGRGRLGRSWASPFGRNIYCSFSYVFNKDISEMSGLSLAVGILTSHALERVHPQLKPFLKWPNDIYLNNKKAGGILIDLMAEANGICTAIISVGLNVNMKDIDMGIDQPWTSLEHVLNEKLDRNRVVAQLIQTILKGVDAFHENGLEGFLEDWKHYDFLETKRVSVTKGTQIITGIGVGIDSKGSLLLELPDGIIEKISYGDTTLLKNE